MISSLKLKKLVDRIFSYLKNKYLFEKKVDLQTFEKVYESWNLVNDAADNISIGELSDCIINCNTFFSIIMPTYNSNTEWLGDAINSVLNQSYENWELCIVDDCSTIAEVQKTLKYYSSLDKRIKFLVRQTNGHISEASNDAISIANGEYIVLLDHDDLLHPHALKYVAAEISKKPDAKIIYTDEDKINEQGERTSPYFKPDFNIDLFLCQNFISHLGVYEKSTVLKVGGFRTEFNGSQDYDLALRVLSSIKHDQIIHIPKVLYHWRIHDQGTAKSIGVKSYAISSAYEASKEYSSKNKKNIQIKLNKKIEGFQEIAPKVIDLNVQIVLIIAGSLSLSSNLHQLYNYKGKYENLSIVEIVGIDDEHYYSNLSSVLERSAAMYYIVVDSSIVNLSIEDLDTMISNLERDDVGLVGGSQFYDGRMIAGGIVLGVGEGLPFSYYHVNAGKHDNGYYGRLTVQHRVLAVSCLLYGFSKKTYYEAGGFYDYKNLNELSYIDFCLRIHSIGLSILYLPRIQCDVSSDSVVGAVNPVRLIDGSELLVKELVIKWRPFFINDPFYNLNLTRKHPDFSVNFNSYKNKFLES
jgi:glycosyltransferase involved in cell wall biosynthesis